jgi:hypothetical protein
MKKNDQQRTHRAGECVWWKDSNGAVIVARIEVSPYGNVHKRRPAK